MRTTFDARIYEIDVYEGKTTTTYWVQWKVAGKLPLKKKPFKQKALAVSYRSTLLTAARKGEAFDVASGLPVSMSRATLEMSCYELACRYVDLKWPRAAAMTRKTNAEALTAALPLLFKRTKSKPDDRLVRTALRRWAFNTPARKQENKPEEIQRALAWIERNARPASDLSDPKVLRAVLDGMTLRLDGLPGSPVVVTRRRKIFTGMLEHGAEIRALEETRGLHSSGRHPGPPTVGSTVGGWRILCRYERCWPQLPTRAGSVRGWSRSTRRSTSPRCGQRKP